jgi:hypothetical protein
MLTEMETTLRKTLPTAIACGVTLLVALGTSARAEDCAEPETGTKNVPIFSPPISNVVTGAGRLQFYSAPKLRCPVSGVFVIPNDELTAYAETDDGWSSVMYTNPRTNNIASGWVRSERLRRRGTVGPRQ